MVVGDVNTPVMGTEKVSREEDVKMEKSLTAK